MKPLYHRDWDVLWATAAECAMPISFHALGWSPRAPDPAEQQTYDACFKGVRRALAQISGIEFLPSIIFSGACDRFPEFKFVLGECGVSWIPYLLDRMDHDYKDRLHRVLNLSCSPRELWHRQGYSTYQTEASVPDVVHLVGEDNIIWGSDYPHPDGVWPDSKTVIAENLGTLNERIRRKICLRERGKTVRFCELAQFARSISNHSFRLKLQYRQPEEKIYEVRYDADMGRRLLSDDAVFNCLGTS